MRIPGFVTPLAMFLLVLVTGCADTLSIQTRAYRQEVQNPIKRVAVVDFAGEAGQSVADMLSMQLQRSGFEVVERQYLSDLVRGGLKPIKDGSTDATVTERLGKIGKMLNADAIITGDLVRFQGPVYERAAEDKLKYEMGVCEISARAFDVRTREVFWITVINVTASAKTGDELQVLDFMNEACAELAESFTNHSYKDGAKTYKGKQILDLRQRRAKGAMQVAVPTGAGPT